MGYGAGAPQHNSNHLGFSHSLSSSQVKGMAASQPPWAHWLGNPTEAARRNYYTQCLLDVLSHATLQEIQDCFSHNKHSAHRPPSKHGKKVCLNMLVMRSHVPGEVRIQCLTGNSMADKTISELELIWPSVKASFGANPNATSSSAQPLTLAQPLMAQQPWRWRSRGVHEAAHHHRRLLWRTRLDERMRPGPRARRHTPLGPDIRPSARGSRGTQGTAYRKQR